MLFTKSLIASLFAFTAISLAAPVQPTEHEARAPHPFEVARPAANATVGREFEFLAADGEQFSMLYVEAVLKNKCGNEYTIVKKTRYDNYVVDKNVTLHHDIKKGTYELIATETDSKGQVTGTVTQLLNVD